MSEFGITAWKILEGNFKLQLCQTKLGVDSSLIPERKRCHLLVSLRKVRYYMKTRNSERN